MGSLCSKSSTLEGGHTVLGSGPVNSNAPASNRPGASSQRTDPRAAAAEAAERRLKAVGSSHHEYKRLLEPLQAQARGTNAGNPKQGKLASQLAKQNNAKPGAQAQSEPAQLVVRSIVFNFIGCRL